MIEFLFLDTNAAYGIAFAIVLMLAILEIAGLLIGLTPSELVEQTFSGVSAPESLSGLLGWFFLNKLPFSIWLIIFLTVFSISGYTSNFLAVKAMGQTLPSLISHSIALVFSFMAIRIAGTHLGKFLSERESSAVSSSSFSGQIASITLGKATFKNPAEAVLTDQYRQKHYIMVMPCSEEEYFTQGDNVVLVEKRQSFWTAIKFNDK